MIRVLGYLIAFSYGTLFGVVLGYALLLVIIGIIMFVTLSLPVALPFTWVVFRLIVAFGVFLGVCYMFSNDGRYFVDKFVESFNKRYNTNEDMARKVLKDV